MDGFTATYAVLDETHVWCGRDLADRVREALATGEVRPGMWSASYIRPPRCVSVDRDRDGS